MAAIVTCRGAARIKSRISRKIEARANTSPPSTRARARAREAGENQRSWPADKVERWAIDRLIPYAKNARTHTGAQIAAIAASVKEWGWTTPVLVGEDGGGAKARLRAGRQSAGDYGSGWNPRKNFFLSVNHLTLLDRFLNDAA